MSRTLTITQTAALSTMASQRLIRFRRGYAASRQGPFIGLPTIFALAERGLVDLTSSGHACRISDFGLRWLASRTGLGGMTAEAVSAGSAAAEAY